MLIKNIHKMLKLIAVLKELNIVLVTVWNYYQRQLSWQYVMTRGFSARLIVAFINNKCIFKVNSNSKFILPYRKSTARKFLKQEPIRMLHLESCV